MAKRLIDKGPQFVGAHVLKVRKLARLISLRPLHAFAREHASLFNRAHRRIVLLGFIGSVVYALSLFDQARNCDFGPASNLTSRHALSIMRVLVVDDEALIVVLEDLGCEVETAFNGSQALTKLWNDRHIEVLITDVNMPGISGYQLAERAKEMRPELKVIMLSGAETDPLGWPLVRQPFLLSDLMRAISDVGGTC